MQTTDQRTSRGPGVMRAGFTLVEILIVVIILGILAAIAIPKLSNASQQARENTLKDDLRFLRTQILVYGTQHHDVYPGYAGGDKTQSPTAAVFLDQLIQYTDEWGNVSSTNDAVTYRYGPYLSRMPDNPLNGKTEITIITGNGTMTPDGTTGWLYQPETGQIRPNLVGADSEGASFANY